MVLEIFVKKAPNENPPKAPRTIWSISLTCLACHGLLADMFSGDWGMGVCGGVFLCFVPTLQFSFIPSRLARHLQKEAQSQHNNSEFTEDQKVGIAVCSGKELDS